MIDKHDITSHDHDYIKAVLAGAAGTFPSLSPTVAKGMAHDALGLIEVLEAENAKLHKAMKVLLTRLETMPNPHENPMRAYYNQLATWKNEARKEMKKSDDTLL